MGEILMALFVGIVILAAAGLVVEWRRFLSDTCTPGN